MRVRFPTRSLKKVLQGQWRGRNVSRVGWLVKGGRKERDKTSCRR